MQFVIDVGTDKSRTGQVGHLRPIGGSDVILDPTQNGRNRGATCKTVAVQELHLHHDELFRYRIGSLLVEVIAPEAVHGGLCHAERVLDAERVHLRVVERHVEDARRTEHPVVVLVHRKAGDVDFIRSRPGTFGDPGGDVALNGQRIGISNGRHTHKLVILTVVQNGTHREPVSRSRDGKSGRGAVRESTMRKPAVPRVVLDPFDLGVVVLELLRPTQELQQIRTSLAHIDE